MDEEEKTLIIVEPAPEIIMPFFVDADEAVEACCDTENPEVCESCT